MFCQWCGSRLPDGAMHCPACGKAVPASPPAPAGAAAPPPPPKDVFDRAIDDTARAAQELLDASKRMAESIARRARGEPAPEVASRARKALHTVAEELRHAGKEIEKALNELK